MGVILAWVLVRYEFSGKRIMNGIIELPFALPTAVAGIALTSTIHRSSSTRLNRLKNSGSGSGKWSGKRKNGNSWQNGMRTAMVVLLLSPDIQMAAHRMV